MNGMGNSLCGRTQGKRERVIRQRQRRRQAGAFRQTGRRRQRQRKIGRQRHGQRCTDMKTLSETGTDR